MKYTTRAKKRTWPSRLLFVAGGLVVLLLVAIAVVRHAYFDGLKPLDSKRQSSQLITIERGETLDEIANQLKDAGIIRSAWAFKLYASSKDARDYLQAGTYSFSPSQSVEQIVALLSHGKVATDLVTILPGQRLTQIRTALVNYGFKASDVDAALDPAAYKDNPALVDKPAGASLEGYLYPDSFQKDASTKPTEIIKQSLHEMNTSLTPDIRSAFAAQGLSVYQGITLASIVEREVSKPADRAQVAQVFLKRLRIGMALESNATDPVFSTYDNKGLPPTPISNVTSSSLQAVAHPATTDWLYFVSGDDGATHFSNTLDEHQANVARYCHKLCGQ